jgi:hypothetical protein
MSSWQILSPILWVLLNMVTVSFAVQKQFSLMQSNLFTVSLRCWAIWILFRKLFSILTYSSVFPTASCHCFKVSDLILRSLIHFELILVQGERQRSGFSCLHVNIQFSLQHFLKRPSFLHHVFWDPLLKLAIDVWVYVWNFYSDPLVFLSVFCSNTMLIILLWLYSKVWSWVLWCLQHWTFCSELLWLFEVFCVIVLFHDCFFYCWAECHWNFERIMLSM